MKTKTWAYTIQVLLCAGALASGLTSCTKREKISAKSLVRNNNTSSGPGRNFAISLPASNPFTSADSTVQLQGTCVTGATIDLSGPSNESITCSSGVFSLLLSQSSDGIYNYTLTHTLADQSSTTTSNFQWVRNTSLPPTPTVTTPPVSPVYTNTNAVPISGSCVAGNQILVSGDLSATTTCSSTGGYSTLVMASVDNAYQLDVKQKNPLGVLSAAQTVLWVRDTVPPPAPVLTAPLTQTTQNNLNALVFSGSCENDAVVSITGDLSAQIPCASGSFSVPVTASSDGTYQLEIKQTDLAGNHSTGQTRTWIRSSAIPSAPQITSPSSNPLLNNQNSVLLTGTCDTGNQVLYLGDATGTVNCVGGAFSVTLSALSDAERTYYFEQKNGSGLTSPATLFTWKRDTVAPAPITVTGPGVTPYTSAGNSITLTGTCEGGAAISIVGTGLNAQTQCSSGQFTHTLSASSDGTRTYSLTQVDAAMNSSSAVNWTWIRDSSVPAAPILTAPLQNPFYSNGDSLQLTGTCVSGNTVRVEGSAGVEGSVICDQNSFTLNVTRTTDAAYAFNLFQRSVSGVDSSALLLTWHRDTLAPSTPTFNAPAVSPYTTNGDSIVIAGQCEDYAILTLDGDSQQQTLCSGGNYSFQVDGTVDAVRNYLLSQTDRAGNTSPQGNRIWIRDTIAPMAVTISAPGTNPFISGDATLTLSGTCEAGGTVELISLPGTQPTTQACTAGATYSFNLSQSGNGTYLYSLTQKDLAGNPSPATSFEWTIDNSIPPSPIITNPNTSPIYTNTRTLNLQITCEPFAPTVGVVTLNGDLISTNVTAPANSLSQNCTSGTVQFSLLKPSDGSYSILVDQTNPNTGATSAPVSLLWVVDTVAPSSPTLISPSSNPYIAPGDLTLQGTCEEGATLSLQGAATQSEVCQGGSFQWTISHLPDGEYDFSITQTDLALNVSPATTLHWTRSENALAPPVILSPATNPHSSNQVSLSLAGTCKPGATVALSGPQTGSTPCPADGQFSFDLTPSSDGTLVYDISQSQFGISSSSVSFQWNRDTVAPNVQLTAQPPAVNLANNASFAFSSNEVGSTFECKLDSGNYTACSSPVSLTVANGLHSYSIRATDTAGNVSLAQIANWEQKSYNTLALYRFDTTTDVGADSGLYANNMVNNGAIQSATPTMFTRAAQFTSNSSQFLSVAQNASLNLGTSQLTIEGFFRLNNLAARNDYYTLVYKGSSATDLSYEVRLRRGNNNNNYFIDVVTKLSSASGTMTSSTPQSIGAISGVWVYFAITYSQGVLRIYFGNAPGQATTLRGTFTLGTSTAALAISGGALQIGRGPTNAVMRPLNGAVDEIRISQTVRNVLIVPNAPFDPNQ